MKQQRRTHAAIDGDDASEHDDVITARMQLLHDAVDPAQRTRNVRRGSVLARHRTARVFLAASRREAKRHVVLRSCQNVHREIRAFDEGLHARAVTCNAPQREWR